MSNVKFDYSKVDSETSNIKKSAQEKLTNYVNKQYKVLEQSMESSKGDFKNAIVVELEAEKNAVIAMADFIVKLQDMMKNTSDAFKNADASYTNGAVILNK